MRRACGLVRFSRVKLRLAQRLGGLVARLAARSRELRPRSRPLSKTPGGLDRARPAQLAHLCSQRQPGFALTGRRLGSYLLV